MKLVFDFFTWPDVVKYNHLPMSSFPYGKIKLPAWHKDAGGNGVTTPLTLDLCTRFG
jgi:hypothetical protein